MKLHPDCYKIVDPRIDSILSGGLSLEAFARTLTADDPFVLLEDTIYALSENEFYSTRSLKRIYDEFEQTFQHVMSLTDLSFATKADQEFIQKVRSELPTCPVCKYKRYRQSIYKLAKHYGINIEYHFDGIIDSVSYPATKGDIASTVTTKLNHIYDIPKQDRKPCMDCVEKHVAQAYILACESEMGYPEHRILMCGHLAEAIDESPSDVPELKTTLQTCMATTMKTGEAFLPLYPVLALIKMIRQRMGQDPIDSDFREENPPVTDTIDLTDQIKYEIQHLPPSQRLSMWASAVGIKNVILEYKIHKKEEARIKYEGLVANLADSVVGAAPLFANMLRNRRLMFVADPSLAADAGYDFNDIIEIARAEQ